MAALRRTERADRADRANAAQGRLSNGGTNVSEYAETLNRTGITRQTAHRWQQLAKVPEHEFEEALRAMCAQRVRARRRAREPSRNRTP